VGLGWQPAELTSRRKHDPAKLEIAARLWRETTFSVKQIMSLPEKDRLDLARRIVTEVLAEREISTQIARAVGGIEDVVAGRVRGLSEEEFRDALE
jgi:hypothetical protein